AELERARRDDRPQPALGERLLDRTPLRMREAPVVCAGELLARLLVDALAKALAEPAAVGEDDRARVRADLLHELGHDRFPTRGALPASTVVSLIFARLRLALPIPLGYASLRALRACARGLRPLAGHPDLQIERRLRTGVDDRAGAVAAEAARHLGQRPRGRREADALRIPRAGRGHALEREREVRAALGGSERVDLVDDHARDARECLALLRAEDEV